MMDTFRARRSPSQTPSGDAGSRAIGGFNLDGQAINVGDPQDSSSKDRGLDATSIARDEH